MKIELARSIARVRARAVTVGSSGLVLAVLLSGCASTGAPAPVEQRASTENRTTGGYRERVQPPGPQPARGESESAVQVTGLGEDAAPSEPLPAWSSPTQSGSTQATSGTVQPAPTPKPTARGAAQGDFTAANPAVVALLNRANRESAAGRQGASAASLERAIKIEPGNAWLWHRLAQTRLKQNKPGEAASIAARSNSLAGNNDALRARNWRLIASVHELRGETVAAQAARSKAERLERGTS